jgi:predicted dehydrogenase
MGMNALRHGKHVLLDKPVAVSVADCAELVSTAKKTGLVCSVVFHQRAYPKYQMIRKMIPSKGSVPEKPMTAASRNRTSPGKGGPGGSLPNQTNAMPASWIRPQSKAAA